LRLRHNPAQRWLYLPHFHVSNREQETTWTVNTSSSVLTIVNIFFTSANHVEMMLWQTPHQLYFAI
jgi:hypothetical protein